MSFPTILCATDFSHGADQALRTATRLAMRARAELVIAHAWHLPALAHGVDWSLPADVIQRSRRDAEGLLAAAVENARAMGAQHVRGQLVAGAPSSEIVGLLEAQAIDLCVVGTQGRTGIGRVLLGSIAEKVVRCAPCSVLVVHPANEPGPFMHVLVPTDFSECTADATRIAADVVEPSGSITLLHVNELPVALSGSLPVDELERKLDARAMVALEQAATSLCDATPARVTTMRRTGYAGAEILHELERDPSVDLVVMGSHGRTGLERIVLGSVAEKVVRHARCPVLVARTRR